MQRYSYNAFGLKIISELELPELQPTDESGVYDIKISLGKVPVALAHPKITGIRFERNEHEFLLNVLNVAGYYASANEIVIRQYNDSDLDSVRIFLYTSVFPAILILNKYLPIQASALERGGKAFLIAGEDGAGKSSIAGALNKRGYNIISDDISVIVSTADCYKALPGIVFPILWENTIKHLGKEINEFKKVRPVINRYWFNDISTEFNNEHNLTKIFFLKENNCDNVECKEVVTDKEKHSLLIEKTAGGNFLFGNENKELQLKQCEGIVRDISMWEICRPADMDTIDETISLIEKKLLQ